MEPSSMTSRNRFTYKDMSSGKIRFTTGRFVGWTSGGPFGFTYAIFQTRSTDVLVPKHCLTTETKERLQDSNSWQSPKA